MDDIDGFEIFSDLFSEDEEGNESLPQYLRKTFGIDEDPLALFSYAAVEDSLMMPETSDRIVSTLRFASQGKTVWGSSLSRSDDCLSSVHSTQCQRTDIILPHSTASSQNHSTTPPTASSNEEEIISTVSMESRVPVIQDSTNDMKQESIRPFLPEELGSTNDPPVDSMRFQEYSEITATIVPSWDDVSNARSSWNDPVNSVFSLPCPEEGLVFRTCRVSSQDYWTTQSDAVSYDEGELVPAQPMSTSMECPLLPAIQDFAVDSTTTRQSSGSRNATSSGVIPTSPLSKNKKKRLRNRPSCDVTPTQIIAQACEDDVLFGKGGKINKHSGNLKFHDEKRKLQNEYLDCTTTDRRKQELVKHLHRIVLEWGGRFLKRAQSPSLDEEETEIWVEASPKAALEKCRQALATAPLSPEDRSARRRMFLEKKRQRMLIRNN